MPNTLERNCLPKFRKAKVFLTLGVLLLYQHTSGPYTGSPARLIFKTADFGPRFMVPFYSIGH